jgi:hypothetical protein
MYGQIKPDKYYHAGAGCIISVGTYALGQYAKREMNPIAPSVLAIGGAWAKESIDSYRGGQFSYSDFAWTAISGIVTNIVIRQIWKPRKKIKDPFDIENDPLVKNH